eukprot:3905371-Pleurochrysis_carterae.AAC.2
MATTLALVSCGNSLFGFDLGVFEACCLSIRIGERARKVGGHRSFALYYSTPRLGDFFPSACSWLYAAGA